MTDRPPILITRPEPQATRFAQSLRRMDWTGAVHVAPLMRAAFLPVTLPALDFQAVILTSETAVLAAARLTGLPRLAWCVGDRTAQVARAKGFDARSARGDADALVTAIIQAGLAGPLLYLHARDTRGQVAQRLNSAGIETHAVLAYAQDPCPLTQSACRLIRRPGPVILPILSPRTAALLVQEWQRAGAVAAAHVVALSPAVAQAAAPLHPASLATAAAPDGESLLEQMKLLMLSAPWA